MAGDKPRAGGGVTTAAFSFGHEFRVRWSEVDRQGVVFNPHYLAYFDLGLTEYMRTIGFDYPDGFLAGGSDIFAVEAGLNYRSPARYDDVLTVHFRTARLGSSSVTFDAAISRGGVTLADGHLVYVNVAAENRRPVPLPRRFLDLVAAFENTPPDSKARC